MLFKKLAGLCLVLTLFTLFTGCSRKSNTNWLIGEWIFDNDLFSTHLSSETKAKIKELFVEQPAPAVDSAVSSPASVERDSAGEGTERLFDRDMTLRYIQLANIPPEVMTKIEELSVERPRTAADSTVSSLTSTEEESAEGMVRGSKPISAVLSFTSIQATFTGLSGPGSTSSYSILKRPDDNTLVIKWNGQVTTFTRSGELLTFPVSLSGDVQINLYFRRKN